MLEGMSQEKNEETTILDTADFTESLTLTFAHKSVRIFHTCLYASKMSLARYGDLERKGLLDDFFTSALENS